MKRLLILIAILIPITACGGQRLGRDAAAGGRGEDRIERGGFGPPVPSIAHPEADVLVPEAQESLAALEESAAKETLMALAYYVIDRNR